MSVVAPVLLYGRCNPYGHESGGPRRLLGGLYGPEYEGRYKWTCERMAEGRYRMTCQCGHRGQAMALCGPGLLQLADGGYAAHPGHVASIAGRQAGACPRCLFPGDAAQLSRDAEIAGWQLGQLQQAGLEFSQQASRIRQAMKRIQDRLDEMNRTGVIHRCPLTLTEVS